MLHADHHIFRGGLPDPERDAQFYDGVNTRRLLAWGIDVILAGLIALALLMLLALPTFGLIFFATFAVFGLTDFAYRLITLASGSATPGMRIMGIELRGRDGNRIDLPTALLHTLGYWLSMGFVAVQLVSVLLMIGQSRGRGLTDLVLGTAMINRPL
jgi:uncharacterized RDD family membrane protein YckC